MESIFAAGELITVSKAPKASWESVLPPVIAALGGSSDRLRESGLPSSGEANAPRASTGGVSIRLQVSQGLPIQVEAAGWLGMGPPVRAKLSARFGSAMGLLVGEETCFGTSEGGILVIVSSKV